MMKTLINKKLDSLEKELGVPIDESRYIAEHYLRALYAFSKVQAFSLETAGTFDLDAELELWFSGLGRVKFEFKGNTDVAYLNKLIGHHVL